MKKYIVIFLACALFPTSKAETLNILAYEEIIWNGMNQYKAGNLEEAHKVFSKMSKWGDKYSQYYLGNMYLRGEFVEQNIVQGAAWLQVAGEAKKKWQTTADQVFGVLTADEKKEATKLGEEYIRLYGMKAQRVSCSRRARTGTNIKVWGCTKQAGNYDTNDLVNNPIRGSVLEN